MQAFFLFLWWALGPADGRQSNVSIKIDSGRFIAKHKPRSAPACNFGYLSEKLQSLQSVASKPAKKSCVVKQTRWSLPRMEQPPKKTGLVGRKRNVPLRHVMCRACSHFQHTQIDKERKCMVQAVASEKESRVALHQCCPLFCQRPKATTTKLHKKELLGVCCFVTGCMFRLTYQQTGQSKTGQKWQTKSKCLM